MRTSDSPVKRADLGYFGNIWVRQNVLEKSGDSNVGHMHHFDHVSLLARGRVEVEIEGYPPKQFEAPTFIVIRKEHRHKFTAVTNDVLWYCVFALRGMDGEPIDELFDPEFHDPKSAMAVHQDYWKSAEALEAQTTQT